MKYELKDPSEMMDAMENYESNIDISDWSLVDDMYQKHITHNLQSTNLIVAFYDNTNTHVSNNYKILSENAIIVYSTTTDPVKVIINCSQGTSSNKTGNVGGSVSPSDFIDDNRIRSDRTYSSVKLESEFDNILLNLIRILRSNLTLSMH